MAHPPALTRRKVDYPRWYQDVVAKAELAESGPVRGTMVIRPYGYAIWERMQAELDARIKAAGASNAYFPLFIPQSYLRREADHVEGFDPELAVVTHGGGKLLDEPVVVRPTSETVVNAYLARWIQSYRDLPMLVNQWANVVRWELRPRLFLRTTEFLWQEGHTAHATESDARSYALRILNDVYRQMMRDVMAVPVLVGRKTDRERFAGATSTWTCEAMMGDGKALQMGTSHELGQNFAKAFGIDFQSETGETVHAWQTSWGASTRLIGALVMVHGDDLGLRLPPRLAPVQVVVLLVRDQEGAGAAADTLVGQLANLGLRVELDARTDVSFGRRVTGWEIKGVPVRVEIGPRDLALDQVVVVRRDTGERATVAPAAAAGAVAGAIDAAQSALLAAAASSQAERTIEASSLAEVREAAQTGFVCLPWRLLGDQGEDELASEGLTVRCLLGADGGLPEPATAGHPSSDTVAVIARSY